VTFSICLKTNCSKVSPPSAMTLCIYLYVVVSKGRATPKEALHLVFTIGYSDNGNENLHFTRIVSSLGHCNIPDHHTALKHCVNYCCQLLRFIPVSTVISLLSLQAQSGCLQLNHSATHCFCKLLIT